MSLHWNRVVQGAAGIGAVSLLAGCSAANGIINSNIPAVDNLLQLDNQDLEATVGATRAVVTTTASRSATFSNRSLPEASRLNKVRFEQSFSPDVIITPASSGSRPTNSFSLSNIRLDLSVSDSGREASASRTIAGPVVFTRVGDTDTYRSAASITFDSMEISGASFGSFRDIVTGGSEPNTARGQLRFDSDDTQLPAGTVLTFRFTGGKARVQI